MTVRVQNGSNIAFGRFATAATVSHLRAEMADGTVLFTRPLTAGDTAVALNNEFEIPAGDLDFVFPEGHLENAGLKAIMDDFFDGTLQITIRAMTDSSTEVAVSGYSAQKTADWGVTTE